MFQLNVTISANGAITEVAPSGDPMPPGTYVLSGYDGPEMRMLGASRQGPDGLIVQTVSAHIARNELSAITGGAPESAPRPARNRRKPANTQ